MKCLPIQTDWQQCLEGRRARSVIVEPDTMHLPDYSGLEAVTWMPSKRPNPWQGGPPPSCAWTQHPVPSISRHLPNINNWIIGPAAQCWSPSIHLEQRLEFVNSRELENRRSSTQVVRQEVEVTCGFHGCLVFGDSACHGLKLRTRINFSIWHPRLWFFECCWFSVNTYHDWKMFYSFYSRSCNFLGLQFIFF